MDCVNHSGVTATAFCQNCGKPLCGNCVRNGAGGQILCEPCWMAWQNVPNPFVASSAGEPNPAAAAVLGLIPGVGAMYNGQFFKGLIHVVIFAVLISITEHYGIFGLFIGAWVLYQSFEAYHTAKARRDGMPLPDPLGLNEVGNWLNLGAKNTPGQPGTGNFGMGGPGPGSPGAGMPGPVSGSTGGAYQAPYTTGSYQPPFAGQPPYAGTYPPPPGYVDPSAPPMPPVPPAHWRRKEPIGAIILIGLGILFLIGQINVDIFKFSWPHLLIGLGVWLVIRQMGHTKGGPQ
jgi:TM2 domain-containing membrane protein YozV